MFQIVVSVEKKDVVPGYNHVHHTQIVSFLELARLKLLESRGIPNEDLIDQGLFIVITGLEVRFLREIKVGEIVVTCEQVEIDGRRLCMKQRIIDGGRNRDMVRASIELMVISKEAGRAIPIPSIISDPLRLG